MTRAIVCGDQYFKDKKRLFASLDMLHDLYGFTSITHGAATGADSLAGEWARSRGVNEQRVPADWSRFGRTAGFWRNCKMLDMRPDLVVAFPGGTDTQNMINLAENEGVKVIRA